MIKATVVSKILLNDSVCELKLVAENGLRLPEWQAGAHIDVQLPGDFTRQYSLCGQPQDNHYTIAVLKDKQSRGGSVSVHETVQKGDTLIISEPRNHFALDNSDAPSYLFAAGIGITPVVTMAEACQKAGRPFRVFYAVADDKRAVYADRLGPASCVHVISKAAFAGKRVDLNSCFYGAPDSAQVYVCGPGAFIQDVLSAAKNAGLSPSQLHREFFTAAETDTSSDEAFEIELKSSGDIFTVNKDSTILSVLEENDVFVPVSCEEGVCGTCVTGLLDGEADHRDVFLTDEEKQQMRLITPCCSRARSGRLVLDL
ncbi:PDR/VanB family oxidoreductase [Alteromonas sp. 1_MG-2023]|uniref:PDR/VanB family oxidoreductase n=1 Tax=Alteromonas sp. 1_MG-2023 TaxID=3062669 RepID=UPI0026E2CA71|nr:PDR/VanB family oxidoreductase [Alteromonas sp. 1_MG-2023]MDO6475160.1 PDR/VanB family oxidoreductase [Alteromonas sp. 1_MG-2023]